MAKTKSYTPPGDRPDMFGRTATQRAEEYANKLHRARIGQSSAEIMADLQKASRGNPAPRGGVTGRLEGNLAQGTGKSKLPWEKAKTVKFGAENPYFKKVTSTRGVEGGVRLKGFSIRGGQGGGGGGLAKDKYKTK